MLLSFTSKNKKGYDDINIHKSDCILSGPLGKLTSSKKWVKRFYVLEPHRLTYHSKQSKANVEEIPMGNILSVRLVGKMGKVRFVFEIETFNKTIRLKGISEEEAVTWVKEIGDCINNSRQRAKKRFLVSDSSKLQSNVRPTSFTLEKKSKLVQSNRYGKRRSALGGTSASLSDFQKLSLIGQGSYGKVYLCQLKPTGQYFAMKILNKDHVRYKEQIEHTMTERHVLAKVKHPFLMNMHYAFQTENNLYLILDFVNGGELFHHLELADRFDDDRTRFYAAEIILAIEYLHRKGVLYRDLKPENVLLNANGHVVLTDFGLSKELAEDESTMSFCGTPEYLSPEIIRGESYTSKVDWWTLGMLIYEMIVGVPAYEADSEVELYNSILYQDIYIPSDVSKEAADLIRALTHKDKDKRLTDSWEIKNHPFFHSIDWDRLLRCEIEPPYVPDVKGPQDLALIDSEYLDTTIEDSDIASSVLHSDEGSFEGFVFERDTPTGQ
eukprot:TRINITY_DN2503_c0_g1_i1.p1 TRINITY_DN2503_c0_g1~~TRINITY_DN2503_c0_g1_i1.p1  ORF type:complete len:496 (+),score=97.24 TRINITY_DN2503_c0_g1_i1:24-1511(+)